jgi:hypothetical protein
MIDFFGFFGLFNRGIFYEYFSKAWDHKAHHGSGNFKRKNKAKFGAFFFDVDEKVIILFVNFELL